MLSCYTSFTYLLFLTTLVSAMPVFHNKKIVTRVHTASTTNTVTDYYSTTTEVVVAPTVQFIVSEAVTFTTTLYPEGVPSTALPGTTITIQQHNVAKPTLATAASSSAVAPAPATSTAAAPAPATSTTAAPATSSTIAPAPATSSTTTLEPATPATSTTHTRVVAITVASGDQTATTFVPVLTDVVNNEHTSVAPGAGNNNNQQTTFSTVTTAAPSTTQQEGATTTSTSSQATSTFNSNSLLSRVPDTLVYSPYNSDGSCRSATDVYGDLSIIKARGVNKIRVYGTDCGSLETVLPVCAQFGMKVNQGLWISSAGVESINDAVTSLITYGQTNGWDVFDFITVGNEAIISGYCSVSDLIAKIASVKSQFQAAGYSGRITTSEPPVSYENNPELCTESAIDFVGINPHSYFDTYSTAETAGTFVKGQLQLIQKTCGTNNVYVTETGYPHAGIQNGGNIPSKANQLIAVQSIIDELDADITILSYTDDFWKNPGPYGIEQSFGIIDILP